jgi:polygalacturonase
MRTALCLGLLLSLVGVIPAHAEAPNIFSANDYGAKGDGVTLNTEAIQAALNAAAKAGHATVTLAAGTYLTGALFVKSHTELRLDRGVTLRGSQSLADYPMLPTRVAGIEMTWPAAVVNVYEQKDVVITGAGTIDGNGKIWWDGYWALRKRYDAEGLRWAADYDDRRPRLIQIYKSKHVRLAGLSLMRSAFWTVHICYSRYVTADGITIRNNIGGRGPSTDGIDIDSSRDVLVEHADISANDDALCLKAGRDADGLRVARPDENITVRDSVVRDGAAAITIGSETSGGFRNIEVYGIHAFGHVPSGILFKSAHTRGGWADNIRIHDLQLDGVAIPIHITMNWNPSYSYAHIPAGLTNIPPYYKILATPVPAAEGLAHFHNVHIWNVKATGAKQAFEVSASQAAPLADFTLDNIDISAASAGTIDDVRNWTFSHVRLQTRNGGAVSFHDASGLRFLNSNGFEQVSPDKTGADTR